MRAANGRPFFFACELNLKHLYLMAVKTLLITPPFTQLNTPYPATAYLSGFLRSKDHEVAQCDLSIELFNAIFSKDLINECFTEAQANGSILVDLVWKNRKQYIEKVDQVISYLRKQSESTAYQIVGKGFLPVGHRSEKLAKGFEKLSLIDKAKHLGNLIY